MFSVLAEINKKHDLFFQEHLLDDQKTEFQPLTTMRWMAGTTSSMQLLLLNEFVNPYTFSLSHHKSLLFKLMTLCSAGPQQNKWIKLKETNGTRHLHSLNVIMRHYRYSAKQAKEVFSLLPSDVIIGMAEQQGCQDDILKKIKVELKNR